MAKATISPKKSIKKETVVVKELATRARLGHRTKRRDVKVPVKKEDVAEEALGVTEPTKQARTPTVVNAGGKKDVADAKELEDPERLARTAFVGNVLATTTRKELKRLFKEYGEVEAVRLRGVIAANPKLPKKTALLARRMHKGCETILAYVVYKAATPVTASEENTGGEVKVPPTGPADAVIQASRNLNLTILNGKHIRVNPAWHTRGPIRQSVFLGNLPFDVTEEELIVLFQGTAEEAGSKLLGVRVTRDKETGMGRGVGFVSFDDELGVRAVMNQSGTLELRGRVIRMERATKEKKMASKTAKRKAKKEEAKSGKDGFTRRRANRQDKRKRDERTGERLTRKIKKERSDKKVKVKVKHAARKARKAAAEAAGKAF